jgi:hypothetical protein
MSNFGDYHQEQTMVTYSSKINTDDDHSTQTDLYSLGKSQLENPFLDDQDQRDFGANIFDDDGDENPHE